MSRTTEEIRTAHPRTDEANRHLPRHRLDQHVLKNQTHVVLMLNESRAGRPGEPRC